MNQTGATPAYGAGEWDDGPGGPDSLLFSCRPGERIVLPGPHVSVRVLAVTSDRVRVAVEAPGGAHVVRQAVRDTAVPACPSRPSPARAAAPADRPSLGDSA
jgi:sRNA-binding carbon storage regulator CsrA